MHIRTFCVLCRMYVMIHKALFDQNKKQKV